MHKQKNTHFRESRLTHQLPASSEGILPSSVPEVAEQVIPPTREALTALHGQSDLTVIENIRNNPDFLASLRGNPEKLANIIANIGVNFLPLLGLIFGVAAIVGVTRWGIRKAFGKDPLKLAQ